MTDRARELLEKIVAWWDDDKEFIGDFVEEIRTYLAEPDPVYLFAGWLTCQPGIMEVGACCDASPMAQAIDQYFQEYPERMFETKLRPAPRPEFVRLSEEEVERLMDSALSPKEITEHELYYFARAIEDALEEKNK